MEKMGQISTEHGPITFIRRNEDLHCWFTAGVKPLSCLDLRYRAWKGILRHLVLSFIYIVSI